MTEPQQPDFLLEPQYLPAYRAWHTTRNPETAGALLKQLNPILDKAITSYGGGSKNANLRSRARQITLDSLESYDPTKAKLQTHLLNQLKGLHRYAAQSQQILSVPEQVMLDNQHLYRAEQDLVDRLGRDPSDRELADQTGLSLKRLTYVRQYQRPVAEGVMSGSAHNEGGPISPAVAQNDPSGWLEFVYHDLNDVDKSIMEYTLGLHGAHKLPTGEIAKKLNISPGAVSQRAQRIQMKLNQRDDLGLGL